MYLTADDGLFDAFVKGAILGVFAGCLVASSLSLGKLAHRVDSLLILMRAVYRDLPQVAPSPMAQTAPAQQSQAQIPTEADPHA